MFVNILLVLLYLFIGFGFLYYAILEEQLDEYSDSWVPLAIVFIWPLFVTFCFIWLVTDKMIEYHKDKENKKCL